mmetsp:Transcript_90041/g.156011  ORF Transcript_90041/g.156011 Transcript_90041/m.156011 type:complete len:217 (-) Transcript_90041:86-736(-)
MVAGRSSGDGKLMQYDYLVKLLLIGDDSVGKSSLLSRFADGKFPTPHVTIGMDFKIKMLDIGGRRVKLQIWDTAGQEKFHSITQQHFRNANGIILVYDVTDEESFSNIRCWATQIAAHAAEDAECLLLGNKADMETAKWVTDAAGGKALADEYGFSFLEASAKTGVHVQEAFHSITNSARSRLQARQCTASSAQTSSFRLASGMGRDRQRRRCCCG